MAEKNFVIVTPAHPGGNTKELGYPSTVCYKQKNVFFLLSTRSRKGRASLPHDPRLRLSDHRHGEEASVRTRSAAPPTQPPSFDTTK